jgi:hypothetical protein
MVTIFTTCFASTTPRCAHRERERESVCVCIYIYIYIYKVCVIYVYIRYVYVCNVRIIYVRVCVCACACVYVVRAVLRIQGEYICKQNWPAGLSNGNWTVLRWVWNWVSGYGWGQLIFNGVALFQASTAVEMRSLLFCDVTQCRSIFTDVTAQPVWSHLKGSSAWPSNMEPTACADMSWLTSSLHCLTSDKRGYRLIKTSRSERFTN